MKTGLCAIISAAFCVACAGGPSVPPPRPVAGAGLPGSASPGEIARLYNDFLRRLPCPEQAICGTGPELPVTAVRCRPSPAPAEARCIFLTGTWSSVNDRLYRCEAAFGRRDGAWEMIDLAEGCSLVSERPRGGLRWAELPDRRTIEEIESGFLLQEALLSGGVAGIDEMNRHSRVKVRGVGCRPSEGGALCSYEADRCRDGEADKDGDGWCRRMARFHIDVGIVHSLTASRGWTMDRAARER